MKELKPQKDEVDHGKKRRNRSKMRRKLRPEVERRKRKVKFEVHHYSSLSVIEDTHAKAQFQLLLIYRTRLVT